MQVNVNLREEIVDKIKGQLEARIDFVINDLLSQSVDEIIQDALKKQMKSVTLMYLQSPELRRKMLDKVTPEIDKILGG